MYPETVSDILIFKTNIRHSREVEKISIVLNSDKRIRRWNIDIEDIDHVLRVETDEISTEVIIGLVTASGFQCEPLPD